MTARCRKCDDQSMLRNVLDVWICPSCVVELRVWLEKPRQRTHGLWVDAASRLPPGWSVDDLARRMGSTRMQAKNWIMRSYQRGMLTRVGTGRYEVKRKAV